MAERAGALLRQDDAATDAWLHRFARVLELPDLVQWMLSPQEGHPPLKVLVVAHPELLRDTWPTSAGGIRPFIQVANDSGVSMIFALGAAPEPNVADVDYVFRLERGIPAGSAAVRAVCDRGSPQKSPGLFARGSTRGLNELIDALRPP